MSLPPSAPLRPRRRAPKERRLALMNAAQTLFLEKGIQHTSVDDIVMAADVAKGTFYVHFGSKDILLMALQQRFIDDFCVRTHSAFQPPYTSWHQRLQHWFEAALSSLTQQELLHDMLFHDIHPASRSLMQNNPVITQLIEFIQQGQTAGVWHCEYPQEMAIIMFQSMHGLADTLISSHTPQQLPALAALLANTFTAALSR
ncbi:MAG: TetR/AcrR family transcriptional regulator [Paenalcaligenes sp.]